jgi:macrolide-specific efflux system membrane fusion protein
LQQGPDQSSSDAAQSVVNAAQQGVSDAQAKLDALARLPTPAQVADAQDQVRRAQAALDAAGRPLDSTGSAGPDLGALQQAVDGAQGDVAALQQQIANTQMHAPFGGTVISVRAKVGDAVSASSPVTVTIAQPGPVLVRAQLDDSQAAELTVGQTANVILNNASATDPPISATVASVTPAAKDGSTFASADFSVQWPDSGTPKFGLPVGVNVTLQQKQGVLILPTKAIHSVGSRTYVEVVDGNVRKTATVQLGISTDDSVEIVSGLSEGQVVRLAS